MFPGPVMFGDANRGQEGVSMGPVFPDVYSNPQWKVSNQGTPDLSRPNYPDSSSPDMNFMPGLSETSDFDRNELTYSETGDSKSDDSDDFGFTAPSFSPYMGPMYTDKVSVNNNNDGMEPLSVPGYADHSPGPINVEPAFNPMFAPENALQYLSNEDASDDDDLLSDAIMSMMDDSTSKDFGVTFPGYQVGFPVDPTMLSTDDGFAEDSGNVDPFAGILISSPSEENDDSVPEIFVPNVPSDSSDDTASEDDLLEIISSILGGNSDDDADTVNNPQQSILYLPDDSTDEISVVYPQGGISSDNYSPGMPQDILLRLSGDNEVSPQDLILPLSEGGLSGEQGTSDDVILLALDPMAKNVADEMSADSGSDMAADEGSKILILVPEEDSSAETAFDGESDLSALSGNDDVPVIQEINVIPAQPEGRGNSGGFSNLLESLLLQKLLFNTDANDGRSKQGNTYIHAEVHVQVNVQPDEDKVSRYQHHPRYWNNDPDGFPKHPNFPSYGLRENDVDYTPAARQAALVMTTIGKTYSSSSAINACSVLMPMIVSIFVIIV